MSAPGVLEEARAVVVADGAGPAEGVAGGEAQLGGAVNDQDERLAGHGGTGALPVRAPEALREASYSPRAHSAVPGMASTSIPPSFFSYLFPP
jgi:hypothetical protein